MRLFPRSLRRHVAAIYGLVRCADEIVDTYKGDDTTTRLDEFERETYRAIDSGYSAFPIVHAFARTAREYSIDRDLIEPFFHSMRMDISPRTYDESSYATYIYGSAEVIGLMCLKLFTHPDDERYESLRPAAEALGAAYQKVNFLRDIAADYKERGRVYFPDVRFETFSEDDKQAILADIARDFAAAKKGIETLPDAARKPVRLSYRLYYDLFKRLQRTPAATITTTRIRVPTFRKLWLYCSVALGIKGR